LPPELPWLTHLHPQFPDSEHLLSFFNSHLLNTPVPGPGAYTVYVWLTSPISHFEKGSDMPKVV
jgi:hypothetical protein